MHIPWHQQTLALLFAAWILAGSLSVSFAQQEGGTARPPVPSTRPGDLTATSRTGKAEVSAVAGKGEKQFQVLSDDDETRSAFTGFADSIDRDLRSLIRDRDAWMFPVTISVSGSLEDVRDSRDSGFRREIKLLPDNSFNPRLYIRLSTGFQQAEATREILRLLVLERMLRPYRESPSSINGKTLKAPDWLLNGIGELIDQQRFGRPSDLYAGIVQSGQVLSADEILNQDVDSLDTVSAAVHTTSAAALIAALLDQPSGQEHFRQFLTDLSGTGEDGMATLLRQHFPGFRGSAGALEKWWSLQVAHMGQKQAFDFLDAAETERALEDALRIRLGVEPHVKPKGVAKFLPSVRPAQPFDGSIRDFEKFIGRKDVGGAFEECRLKLRTVSMRCFPLYRNVVVRYEAVVIQLKAGKKRGMRAELEELDLAREEIRNAMTRVEDYMNYYEATQAGGKSDAYRSYQETRRKIESRKPRTRTDPISKYLDSLELEFEDEDAP